uniref:Sushi domain-containing protein n=1 Tax=Ciona savignyi TaxID=51511 RepID=H2Z7B0_CIOSA
YLLGATVEYSCDSGFSLHGSASATCMETGLWSSPEPTCRGTECRPVTAPVNGAMSPSNQGTWFAGQSVRYSCNRGYVVTGSSVIVCQTDGTWSSDEPTCTAIVCSRPGRVENGGYTLTTATSILVGTRAVYHCNSGYEAVGDRIITCLNTGEWSSSSPICREILCPSLSQPTQGSVVVTSRSVQGVATYSCNTGYRLDGPQVITCFSNGRWSNTPPTCVGITCLQLPSLDNGSFFPELQRPYDVNSVVRYRCDNGYQLSGGPVIRCNSDGLWSEQPPTCTEIKCRDPLEINHGIFNPLPSYYIGSRVSYRCNPGYQLQGDETIICENNGEWSSTEPTCNEIKCSKPAEILKGSLNSTQLEYSISTVLTYTCISGYEIDGQANLVCLSTGTWSHPEPECIEIQCNRPRIPEQGRISGNIIFLKYDVGSSVTFLCRSGYEIDGESTITCGNSGAWSADEPSCIVIQCTDPVQIDNGRIVFTFAGTIGFIRGSVVSINDKYTYSHLKYHCFSEITCRNLLSPRHGTFSLSLDGSIIGTVATFSCNSGYSINGAESLTCDDTGAWSGTEPSCVGITCSSLTAPSNGFISNSREEYGVDYVAVFRCNNGYAISDSTPLTCMVTGQWSSDEPSCSAVRCLQPNIPTNGRLTDRIIFTHYEVGSSVAFECRPGYEIVGVRSITCEDSGQWSDTEPTCRVITCEDRTAPSQGTISTTSTKPFTLGNTVSYTCNNGYQLSGSNTAECQQNGRWSAPPPACRAIECGEPDQVSNARIIFTFKGTDAYIPGSFVRYSCLTGYSMIGAGQVTCQNSGQWSAFPTCEEIKCRDIRRPQSGSYESSASSNIVGAVVTFECISGYSLVGESSITCLDTALWSNSEPTCRGSSCSTPPNTDADIRAGEKTQYIVGDVITYACGVGLEMIGSNRITCQASGQWTSLPPTCSEVACEELALIQNGRHQSSKIARYSVNDVVTYSCNDGYLVSGSSVLTCTTDGSWDNVPPQCIGPACGLPPTVLQATYSPSNRQRYAKDSVVTYSCKSGYRITGDGTVTCQQDGSWIPAQLPTCQGDCMNPNQGFYTPRSAPRWYVGITIQFQCNQGYRIVGESTATCQNNGHWSLQNPTCTGISCNRPGLPHRGSLDDGGKTTWVVGDIVTYSCDGGYALLGQRRARCMDTGQWSSQPPTCRVITCPVPTPPTRGSVAPSNQFRYRFGEVITYSCIPGYQVVGNAQASCMDNGEWSHPVPRCDVPVCRPITRPTHGSFSSTDLVWRVGTEVTFQCSNGYSLVGSATITCQTGAVWTDRIPACHVVTCEEPLSPAHGSFSPLSVSGPRGYNDAVTYHCYDGFILEGASSAVCQQNGEWSNPPPTCRRQCIF